MIPVQHIAASQMFFLLEGMNDAAQREGHAPIGRNLKGLYKRIANETQGGIVDFVAGLSPIIDALTACVLVALESDTLEFPGVFEYEVTAAIGDALYTNNYNKLEQLSEDYKGICKLAMERAHLFFKQGNDVRYPEFMNAAIVIESALSDGTYQFKAGVSR